jgi:hypothetical protein
MFQGPTITLTVQDGNITVSRVMSIEVAEDLGKELLVHVAQLRAQIAAQEVEDAG